MSRQTSILCKRVRNVLAKIYEGNKTLMSSATGNDRSTIAKYESGTRTPTKRFMTGLSHATGISLKWLLGAGGDEIEYGEEAGTERSRPVIKIPCERIPTTTTPGYFGLNRETAPFFNRRSNYWLIAPQDFPVQHVYAGDYLLIRVEDQRRAKYADVGQLFTLKRGDVLMLAPVTEGDAQAGTMLYGKGILAERDLEI